MRFMVMMKHGERAADAAPPSNEYLAAMSAFNEELLKAGVMLGGEGLHGPHDGKKVIFSGGRVRVVDGPFAEAKEMIAGYWIWQVGSEAEAVEWVKRMPVRSGDEAMEMEIRQIFEMADHRADLPQELRDQEASQRSRMKE